MQIHLHEIKHTMNAKRERVNGYLKFKNSLNCEISFAWNFKLTSLQQDSLL
jgi:hypothetical protein